MYFHGSKTGGIELLEPRISNHGIPMIYFSDKRENVLVYLSNAVEKFCRENDFAYDGVWTKWGSYGFDSSGILVLEEYYPNAFSETYSGVSGYIYFKEKLDFTQDNIGIKGALTVSECVKPDGCEFVPDAYKEILRASEKGLIKLVKYEQHNADKLKWIEKTILNEYGDENIKPDYKFFLENKFPFVTYDR
ncbi:MAG: hypothetical protein IJZ72_06980 [Oscillospiraceae bacterium]|nr:hypothetical protein [Oscillospiraceae bacterium]